MSLLEEYLSKETRELQKQGNKAYDYRRNKSFEHPELKKNLLQAKAHTANNNEMILNLALSYGGQDEIIYA